MLLKPGHHIALQVLATISGNFLNITSGISIAWFITNADKFRRYETPLQVPPLIYDEIKWIECSFYIGGFIGTIFLTLMADGFGRKNTLMVLIIPQLSSWMLKMLSSNATELYIARFISGFVTGGSINITMLFVAELADDKIRGRLAVILPLSINLGLLIGFTSDVFLKFGEIPYVTFVILTMFLCTYAIFPDTPHQLYKINKIQEAIQSLQLYRDIKFLSDQTGDHTFVEVQVIRKSVKESRGLFNHFDRKEFFRLVILNGMLISLYGCLNWFICRQFTTGVNLNNSPYRLNEESLRIIVGSIQLIGSVACLFLIDIIGRKLLFLSGIVGILLVQILYISTYWTNHSEAMKSIFDWTPTICLLLLVTSSSIGVSSVIFAIIPETAPNKIRIYIVTSSFSLMWIIWFVLSHSGENLIVLFNECPLFTWIPSFALNVIYFIGFYSALK